MNCIEYRAAVLNGNAANPYDLDHHVESCIGCVRWQEERMDAEDLERGVVTAIPIPGEAATAIEKEAVARLDRTNAHLRRTVAEVHKMMVWHQYAAAAVQGLLASATLSAAGDLGYSTIANRACIIADAMMEAVRQRKMM
jgi:hypothetical protein